MKIVLHCDNDLKRTKGLMYHEPLGEDECAFFTFPAEGKHSFWNNNVDFPISLIFLDKNYNVVDIKSLEKQQKSTVSNDNYDSKYVIEAHIKYNGKAKKGQKVSVDGDSITFGEKDA